MEKAYLDQLAGLFSLGGDGVDLLKKNVAIKKIPNGTVLLSQGDSANKLFIVCRGCLRSFFIKENGSEITSQFFIEGQMVASFESAMTGVPSRQNIDAIEDTVVGVIAMKNLRTMFMENKSIELYFFMYMRNRLIYYMNQHASFILDNPEQRYIKLVQESPELVSRIPQQYIASYLGITPVSLSRIRARLKKQINKS